MSQQLEFDEYITPDGLTYSFHDARSGGGRWLTSFEGQGWPPVTLIEQRGPFQHGTTVLDYRLNPRTMTYIHQRRGCDRSAYWDIRADILNYLRPNRQTATTFGPGKLRKILPSGAKRDIDVWVIEGPRYEARSTAAWRETTVREALRFYAPDPTFYDPVQVSVELAVETCDGLIFPITFPITFCGSTESETDTVAYAGTWLAYPVIYITGPINDAVIRNLTTMEKLEFDYNIPAGRVVTVDLGYGRKTVRDDLNTNLISVLTTDSDLATFHVASDPEAPGGVNSFSLSGWGATVGVTSVRMTYYTRYIGI